MNNFAKNRSHSKFQSFGFQFFKEQAANAKRQSGSYFITCSLFLAVCFAAQTLYAKSRVFTKIPHYRIDVFYDHDQKHLRGEMQVSFSQSAYPEKELLFALPANRFRSPDVRGRRRHRIVPVFSRKRFQDNLEDPKLPQGFSPGSLEIHSVALGRTGHSGGASGEKLQYSPEANPDLEIGYSTTQGLLRVFLPEVPPTGLSGKKSESAKSTIIIEFSTQFPQRTQEGGINGALLAAKWHPLLLAWDKSKAADKKQWPTADDTPSPATYEVKWESSHTGTLITTPGHQSLAAEQVVTFVEKKRPLNYFPLVFSEGYRKSSERQKQAAKLDSKFSLTSFFFPGHERRAKLIHDWTLQFLEFMKAGYGLKVPWKSIRIVAVEAEYEQVDVWNNLLLVPLPNYKRYKFLDRQVLGMITRRLAQLWFGEAVWSNRDTQLWQNLGIPAFLGLRFYQHKFGADAGIFATLDWLNPRYRDHFFEEQVHNIPPNLRYPILSSFRKNPDSQKYLQTLTYKTAMVLSMLEYLMGEQTFQKGLRHFSQTYQGKIAGHEEFQNSMEQFYAPRLRSPPLPSETPYNADGSGSLEWFFSQWFRTAQTLDYRFEDSKTRILPNGLHETAVKIHKVGAARMPVVVALRTEDGREIRRMASGTLKQETVVFQTTNPPEKVSLDPDEHLLETSRLNNHSFTFYRVRFSYDWKKQREHLVLLVPGFGNNAIDGNSFGLGVRYKFDDYHLYAIPGYGTKNKRGLYIFNLDRKDWGTHGMTAGFGLKEFGGVRAQGLRATYKPSRNPGELSYKFHSNFSRETLFAARNAESYEAGSSDYLESGESNALLLEHSGSFKPKDFYKIAWNIWSEQPALEWQSDFSYVRWQATYGQTLYVGNRKQFEWDLIHGTTFGKTPLQKKFQLGSPKVLRGFPQHTVLSNDYLFASRLDFKFPLLSAPLWWDVSAFRIQGTLFYDQGKIWSENTPYEKAKRRQNTGFGVEWMMDTVSLFQVPLKFEVAFPLNDPDYHKPQFILLGTLTGS